MSESNSQPSTAQPSTVPRTSSNQLEDVIRRVMQQQQADLLKVAAENAEKILDERLRREKITEVNISVNQPGPSKHGNVQLKGNINQLNFDYARQIGDLWGKAETLVKQNGDIGEIINQGKKISKEHLKLLRLADREGWEVALAYKADSLASGDEDERKMQKAKKEVKKRQGGETGSKRYKPWNAGSWSEGKFGGYSARAPSRTCWKCGALGHIATRCPRNL